MYLNEHCTIDFISSHCLTKQLDLNEHRTIDFISSHCLTKQSKYCDEKLGKYFDNNAEPLHKDIVTTYSDWYFCAEQWHVCELSAEQ